MQIQAGTSVLPQTWTMSESLSAAHSVVTCRMLNDPILEQSPIPASPLLSISREEGIFRNVQRSGVSSADNGLSKGIVAVIEVPADMSRVLHFITVQNLRNHVSDGHLRNS